MRSADVSNAATRSCMVTVSVTCRKRTAAWVTRQAVVPDERPRPEENADDDVAEVTQNLISSGE